MVADSYFQFPLCALAFGKSADERLNAIIDHSVLHAGAKLWRKLTEEERWRESEKWKARPTRPTGINWNSTTHLAALCGADLIGITYHGMSSLGERHQTFLNFLAGFESRNRRDALVRLKKAWLFDTRDHHGLTYRELSVLCAIYSAIGDKEMAIITRERIRRCALGYRSAAIMQAELAQRTDGARPLTERELRDTITRLHRNKFFARCTVARRITYYSIRLDSEALRKKILERRTYPGFFHAAQAAQDAALTAAIKRGRGENSTAGASTPPLLPRSPHTPPGRH